MRLDVVTLFPGMFPGYLGQSILRKAIERGQLEVYVHDLRAYTEDRHARVDDRPYGGGPGMVLRVEPVVRCVETIRTYADSPGHLVALTPGGQRLEQETVKRLARQPRLILLCGRYEGFDQRVMDILRPEEISIGDYVISGGEVAAMVVIDAVVRWVPGVLGHPRSAQEDSFADPDQGLEAPCYTRPPEFRGHRVPDVLLRGDHEAVARWRKEQAFRRTRKRRADLVRRPLGNAPSPADGHAKDEIDEND